MNSYFSSTEPGKGTYIFVWFLAWVPANIAVTIIDTLLAENIIKSLDDWNTYLLFAIILEVPANLLIAIFVYSKFPYLKISKVVGYVYFFSLLSILNTWRQAVEILEEYNMETGLTSFIFICFYFAICFGFRQFFINSKQW